MHSVRLNERIRYVKCDTVTMRRAPSGPAIQGNQEEKGKNYTKGNESMKFGMGYSYVDSYKRRYRVLFLWYQATILKFNMVNPYYPH